VQVCDGDCLGVLPHRKPLVLKISFRECSMHINMHKHDVMMRTVQVHKTQTIPSDECLELTYSERGSQIKNLRTICE